MTPSDPGSFVRIDRLAIEFEPQIALFAGRDCEVLARASNCFTSLD